MMNQFLQLPARVLPGAGWVMAAAEARAQSSPHGKLEIACENCHTTTAWTGATFNHTRFPTGHGNAGGACAICHTNANEYPVFRCTVCRTQAQTDPHHTGVRGSVYNSTNGYSCHPNGRSGG